MSVSDKFRVVLAELLKARHPLLLVETHEDDRAVDEIASVATNPELRTPRTVYDWSATHGLAKRGGEGNQASKAPAAALQQVLELDEPAVVVFRDLHHALGGAGRPADPNVIRLLRDIASKFRTNPQPGCLVMVSPVSEPPDLEKVVTIVDFALPDEDEIRSLLDGMVEMNKESGRIKLVATEDDLERLTKAAVGLTLAEAENAFARAMVNDGELSGDDVDVILEEKRQTIRKSGVLEFVRGEGSLDGVGGLENLKRWLKKRDDAWLDAAKAWGLPEPKGVLITGVPGCGKSLTAKCVAGAWGLPLLRLDVGRVFAGLVGSSEQNMRSAIRTAEAIAPCVLWVDEIEKGFAGATGGASGDSGTGQRVFGTFLTWLQDKTRPVFVIATANNIDHLPPEFLRKGRFDEIFFVDLPTTVERQQIWSLHLRKHYEGTLAAKNGVVVDDSLVGALGRASEGYSGAEIEQAVIAALFDAYAARRPLEEEDLLRAISNMVPLAVTQAEAIMRIREWADVRAVAATAAAHAGTLPRAKTAAKSTKASEPAQAARGGRTVDF